MNVTPLKDWTLGEVQAVCKRNTDTCSKCVLWKNSRCSVQPIPNEWELSSLPLTSDEIAVCRLLKAGGHKVIHKKTFPTALFPSLGEDDTLNLDEIDLNN